MLLFVIPFGLTLTLEDPDVNRYIIVSCIFPQVFFLIVELIQLKQAGFFSYFSAGWNLVDCTQIMCFWFYANKTIHTSSKNFDELENNVNFLVLKVALIMFSLIKFISLLRVFPSMGFFIKLLG